MSNTTATPVKRQYVPIRILECRDKRISKMESEIRRLKFALKTEHDLRKAYEKLNYHPVQEPGVVEKIRGLTESLRRSSFGKP